ncbi:hypothetical protein NUM3379_40300 [Kineococcus sp. NUM-3379]
MRVLWVYGPPGAGKSTTCWELHQHLGAAGLASAHVDVDQLGMCFPARPEDPDRELIKARALGRLLPVLAREGARLLVVSGVLAPSTVALATGLLGGVTPVFCRLELPDHELRRRLAERGEDEAEFRRVRREAAGLSVALPGHPVVDADGLEPARVAAAVLERTGVLDDLPPSRPGARPGAPPGTGLPGGPPGRVLWLCGPGAVGKSVAGWAVFQELLRRGHTAAYLDAEQLGFLHQVPGGDPHRLRAAGVGAVWREHSAAGATHLLLAGSVRSARDVDAYRRALAGADVTLFRLHADEATLRGRVAARGRGEAPRLAGDRLVGAPQAVLRRALAGALEEQRRLAAEGTGDVVVHTSGRTPAEVAAAVLAHAWPAGGRTATGPDGST